MKEKPFDFAALLSPLERGEFFSTYWEQRHWVLPRHQPNFYQSLINASDLESLISESDARYPAIQLAKGGGYFPPEAYTHNVKHGDESFVGVPDIKKISEEYRRGATVALPAIHRTWKPLKVLCAALQTEFDHPVHANAYLTPGNASGFTPHYDTHEVFVLQIAGKKSWSIYAPVIELPHRSQPFTPDAYSGQDLIAEIELQPGDLLYLPRGFLHATKTSETFSAHVTLGVSVYTVVDLLKEFAQKAVSDPSLRRALAPGFASRADVKSQLHAQLIEGLEQLRATADLDQVIESFAARVLAARPAPPALFNADETVVTLDCMLQAPSADSFQIIQDGKKVFLHFNGLQYQIPAPVERTINEMSKRGTFRGSELTPHLPVEGRLTLIRHLVDIGVLTPVRQGY